MYVDTKCMARKNMGLDINTQCSYKKKFGCYCGIHKKYRFRIDEPLPVDYKTYTKTIELSKHVTKKLTYKLKPKYNIDMPIKTVQLITIDDYMRGLHITAPIKDLKYTLNYYKLSFAGKKHDLVNRLDQYLCLLAVYSPSIDKITFLQKCIRKYLKNKFLKLRGIGYIDRTLCINDYDFYTCDDKLDIPYDYFISYSDDKNFVYCFDVRSLQKLIDTSKNELPINPFSMIPIPIELVINSQYIIDDLKQKNIYEDFEEPHMTPQQKQRDKILRVFQSIDELDNHTNPEWFSVLSSSKLKQLYQHIYEIWVLRADLTDTIRDRIVPDGQLFKLSVGQLSLLKGIKKVQNIVLDVIQRLISSAASRSDHVLGSLYVLTALSEISKDCAQSHPWLLQS